MFIPSSRSGRTCASGSVHHSKEQVARSGRNLCLPGVAARRRDSRSRVLTGLQASASRTAPGVPRDYVRSAGRRIESSQRGPGR